MRHVLTLSAVVLAASLSLASAQVRSQSIVVSPLPVAAPVAHVPSALAELVRRGGSITLQDAQGHTVATVNADGSVTLSAGMILGNATAVSVKVGNTTVNYPLGARVDSGGQLLVTWKNADGRTQVVPLVAAISSAHDDGKKADGKKADGKNDGQQDQDRQDGEGDQGGQHGNSGEHGNAGHPGQPGRGSGHR